MRKPGKPAVPDAVLWKRSAFLALCVRLGLYVIALWVGQPIFPESGPMETLQGTLTQWDAVHYLKLAEKGYLAEEPLRIAFFPLYPLAVWIVHLLIQNAFLASLSVSLFASIVAGFFLQKLFLQDGLTSKSVERAHWFFFVFPTAYFLALPYTESLFLALSIGAFYFARTKRFKQAGILGALACATRGTGLVLLPALLIGAWTQKVGVRKAAWLFLIPLGFLAYLGLNAYVLGDPFAFAPMQQGYFNHEFVPPWQPFLEAFQAITAPKSYTPDATFSTPFVALFALVLTLSCFALLAWGWKKLRPSYQAYTAFTLVLLLTLSGQISFPRYLFSVFPLFMLLAQATENKWAFRAVSTVFIFSMGMLLALFALGEWAF